MALDLEIFYSPYCPRCRKARKEVRLLATAWPAARLRYRERDVLEDLERAVAVGVLQTPALAMDGRLIAGPVPSRKALKELLRRRLNTEG